MTKRKRKATGSVAISIVQFVAIASVVVPSHGTLIAEGFKLKPSSRIWKRQDGSWSGRFIYFVPPSGSKGRVNVTITHVVQWVETE